jgi:hypothetical protein
VPARRWRRLLALILLAAGVGLLVLGLSQLMAGDHAPFLASPPTASPAPTATEPILPPPPTPSPSPIATRTEEASGATPALATEVATPESSPVPATAVATSESSLATATAPTSAQPAQPIPPSPTHTATASDVPPPSPASADLYSLRQRLGVGGGVGDRGQELARLLNFGWYVDWTVRAAAFHSPDVEYVPMVRLWNGTFAPDRQELLRAAAALPGALWLIGNEPDVKWQDNVSPEAYAQAYHDLYDFLKEADPSCKVAIGGVSQPTPLRLRYLDRILQAYQEQYGQSMPVDVWNVHNFILREERDSWGVDIPPGLPDVTGRLYEIADHDNLEIFRQQIVEFRRWMKERGQQDKPLIVTEYGILMPSEYGFPPGEVERFMLGTFEFFRTASDQNLGYAGDGYRLVQRWCWFSLVDQRYPTGNLLDSPGGALTPLGEAFADYASSTP